jgi:hypothetical protein
VNSAKAITYLTALFLAGALAGAFVGFNIGKRSVVQVVTPITPPKPARSNDFSRPLGPGRGWPESTRDRLTRELQLSDEQTAKIDPIIKAFDQQLAEMSQKNWENLALAISNRNERIKPFLTEEQVKKLEERNKRGFKPPGDRGPSPGDPRNSDRHPRHTPETPRN